MEADDPGIYAIDVWFGGYCTYPSFDVYDAAITRYPEASAIPVSVQVEFHTPGRTTTQAHTFTGDVVATERGETHVTLGYFEIDEPPHDEAASERSGTAPNTTPDNPTGGTAAEQTDDDGGLDGRTLALIVATAGIAGAAIITIRWFNFKHKPVEFGSGGRRGYWTCSCPSSASRQRSASTRSRRVPARAGAGGPIGAISHV